MNHVFIHIAQEVAERLQSSHDFPVNRDSNPDETIAKREERSADRDSSERARIQANH